jgi:predicted small lipoprotein YifL
VKPLFYLPRAILICSVFAATAALSACGQIGPLYMPRVPADPDAPPPQMSTPAPAANMSTVPPAFTPNPVAH